MIMKIFKLLLQFIPIVLLVFEPFAVKSQQPYQSSISLQYGFLNYNSYQHDIFNFDSKFRSGGITYRQQLGRLSGINFSGKYYKWSLDNSSELETYALQSMVVFHAGKISSSWKINRLTPYLGAGIGYQQHNLMQEGADSEFGNLYLPLEAGLMFNISSRWSIGAFAEYKIAFGSDIKKQLGVDEKNPDIVNSAGLKLSYHFGQRKKDFSFPAVHTLPAPAPRVEDEIEPKQVSEKAKKDTVQEEDLKTTLTEIPKEPSITFLVKDVSDQPIPGATVIMDEQSGITDENGKYSFTYTVNNTYSYTVSATAFLSRSGKINLEGGNLLLKITMKPESLTDVIDESAVPDSLVAEPVLVKLSKEEIPIDEDKPAQPQEEVLKVDTLVRKVDIVEETIPESDTTLARELVLLPKQISPVSDTIIIPVRLDVIVSRQADQQVLQTDPYRLLSDDRLRVVYDQRLDSLVIIASQLRNRITSIENSNSRLVAEFDAYMSQPVANGQQTFSPAQRSSDFDQSMLQAQLSHELELSRLKQNIELLTAELRQSSLNNQIALENLNREIIKLQTSEPQTRVIRSNETKPEITEPVLVTEPEEVKPKTEPDIKTEQDSDETIELLMLETERLSASQNLLVEQLEDLQKQNQRLLNQISELSKQPEKTVEKIEPVSLEHTIYFAINSTAVGAKHMPKLAEFVNLIKSNPDRMIQLSGFADGLGDQAYNMKLSQRRVQSVKAELLEMGLQNSQMVEQYFGSEKASGGINPNERRVEIRIL